MPVDERSGILVEEDRCDDKDDKRAVAEVAVRFAVVRGSMRNMEVGQSLG